MAALAVLTEQNTIKLQRTHVATLAAMPPSAAIPEIVPGAMRRQGGEQFPWHQMLNEDIATYLGQKLLLNRATSPVLNVRPVEDCSS